MPPAGARKIRVANIPLKVYTTPRLLKLEFSPEQLARIETAADRQSELAKVYLEVRDG